MGINESTIKLLTEPINHLIDNCGKSDCKSKCGNWMEIEKDTTPTIDSLPVLSNLQAKDKSREVMNQLQVLVLQRS